MKNSSTLTYFFIAIVSLFTSCQKVIDVDLNKVDKRYVVDAIITDELFDNAISIIQTKDFDQDNVFDTITNAEIWIRNATTNETYPFTRYNNSGVYKNANILAIPDHVYELLIVIDNDTIRSTCQVPTNKVELDSLVIERSEFGIFLGREIYVCVPIYQDPVGRNENYLIKTYLNNVKYVPSRFSNDQFIDGQVNKSSVSFKPFDPDSDDPEFFNGDTLTVELYNISRPVYDFYATLSLNSSSIISNPANPRSNVFGKNTIGVFNAATLSRKSIIARY